MQVSSTFFAERVIERADDRYEFAGVHDTIIVPRVPHRVRVTLVLVVECQPGERAHEQSLAARVWDPEAGALERGGAPLDAAVRVRPERSSGPPRYRYVPVELAFDAECAGVYRVEVLRDGRPWHSAPYRVLASTVARTLESAPPITDVDLGPARSM